MQDRYVGDVGDFGKYALLRYLIGYNKNIPPLNLGVVWCLFPDENHNSDGRHTSYLQNKTLYKFDRELHDVLRKLVDEDRRKVSAISEVGIFPPDTVFVVDSIAPTVATTADRTLQRETWLSRCLYKTINCDIVFFDPDNGIETQSITKRHPKSGKYIFWDELRPFAERGQSMVVYHHTNRTAPVSVQLAQMGDRLRAEHPEAEVILPMVFRRGSVRVFWLVLQAGHAELVRSRSQTFLAQGWTEHFECPTSF